MIHQPPWTPDRILLLTNLNTQGLSASQMGEKLGTSRNAVIGKLLRLGIPMTNALGVRLPNGTGRDKVRARAKRQQQQASVVKRIKAKVTRPPEPPPIVADGDIPLSQRRTLLELEPHHCRWPCGDPGEPGFYFCGASKDGERVYCAAHHARAIQTREVKWANSKTSREGVSSGLWLSAA